MTKRFISLHDGSNLVQGQVSPARSTSGYTAAYLSFSGSADLKVSIEGAIGESPDTYRPQESDWTGIQEASVYGFHILRTVPTLIRLRVTRGTLYRAVGQFMYEAELLPQQTEGVSITAVEGLVNTSVASAVQAALPLAKSVSSLSVSDVYLSGNVNTASETLIPFGRTLMGNATLTTTGALAMRSRSTLSGLKINTTVATSPGIFVGDDSYGTTLSNIEVNQAGTDHPAIMLANNVNRFFGMNLWTKGGHYGVSATYNPRSMSIFGLYSEAPSITGINVATNGDARTEGVSLIGGHVRQAGHHGVQVWGGDAAIDTTMRQRGVAVLGYHVQDSQQGAGIWATNTSGGTFAGNTVDHTVLEGYDLERVNVFSITGNTAVNVRSGAITILYGSKNIVVSGNAISLNKHMNSGNELGNSSAIAGLVVYIRDDCENILISGQVIDCTIKNQDGSFVQIMGQVLLHRDTASVGPKSISFIGCKFRNVANFINEYCDRIDFIDCVFEYDFDFGEASRPVYALKTGKINLQGVTWRLLGTPYVRSGPNQAPILITQQASQSPQGKPAVQDVRIESCRVLGWGANSSISILTFPDGPDASKVVLLNNAVANIYISSTCATRRISGNYHPDTLADTAVTNV